MDCSGYSYNGKHGRGAGKVHKIIRNMILLLPLLKFNRCHPKDLHACMCNADCTIVISGLRMAMGTLARSLSYQIQSDATHILLCYNSKLASLWNSLIDIQCSHLCCM